VITDTTPAQAICVCEKTITKSFVDLISDHKTHGNIPNPQKSGLISSPFDQNPPDPNKEFQRHAALLHHYSVKQQAKYSPGTSPASSLAFSSHLAQHICALKFICCKIEGDIAKINLETAAAHTGKDLLRT
jgi:hypothetical protein